MAIWHTLQLLTSHPLTKKNQLKAIARFFKWQITTKINPYPVIYSFTSKSKIIVAKGMTGATGNLYLGLHEFADMAFLLHFLRKEDFFVDAGANVGSYTVLASAHVGCQSIAVEPVPSTYNHLMNNVFINRMTAKVTALNIGLGKENATLKFTKTLDTVNHIATEGEVDTIDVPIKTVDEIVGLNVPALIKIDVEGYETEVLKGAIETLKNEKLKAIIIELNGSGGRYGFDEKNIHNQFLQLNFMPFIYNPFDRQLTKTENFGSYNTIYIRDVDFVKGRLSTAEKLEILGQFF
ncbi:FkbM family methyltransferase [Parasediminibacterium sp. JCM 36343]|uniref:FkbM family methyltransferase n=1 Tax=Parasediminibacterium sp. JCM 36343 TaxID=3374279 RepID=UPI003978B304